MKIEEEISQEKFRNEYQKASINLIYTHNWLTHKHKSFFLEYDITPQQFNVLRILRGQYPGSISTSAIRERMLDRSSDASRIVDRIYKQGLVEKKICAADKRLVDVTISDKGLKLLEKLDQHTEKMDNMLSALDVQEAEVLNRLLDKIRSIDDPKEGK